MIGIIIGSIWLLIITILIVNCSIYEMMAPDLFIILLVISMPGLIFIILGIILRVKKKKINKYGKTFYGVVNGFRTLSKEYDDYHKTIFKIFNPEKNIYEEIEKSCDEEEYQINSFVIGKCYNDKVYIQNTIPSSEVPEDIRIGLYPTQEQIHNMNIEMSLDKEYVFIGKTKYKRI